MAVGASGVGRMKRETGWRSSVLDGSDVYGGPGQSEGKHSFRWASVPGPQNAERDSTNFGPRIEVTGPEEIGT